MTETITFTATHPQGDWDQEFTCEQYESLGGDLDELRRDAELHGDTELVGLIDEYQS